MTSNTAFTQVSVWLGLFDNRERFNLYLQTISSDLVLCPETEFAWDQEQWFYDDGFIQSSFHSPTTDVLQLLRGHRYSSSFAHLVQSAYEKQQVGAVNSVILAWGSEITSPASAEGEDYSLFFIGTFPCNPGVT